MLTSLRTVVPLLSQGSEVTIWTPLAGPVLIGVGIKLCTCHFCNRQPVSSRRPSQPGPAADQDTGMKMAHCDIHSSSKPASWRALPTGSVARV